MKKNLRSIQVILVKTQDVSGFALAACYERDTARFASNTRYELKKECAVLHILFLESRTQEYCSIARQKSQYPSPIPIRGQKL